MKGIFLSGASPINNESSTFLYRLWLKAWFGTRPCRCKQLTVGKEARTVSCLPGLWNTCFSDGASVVKPAWQRLALVIHSLVRFPTAQRCIPGFLFTSLSVALPDTQCSIHGMIFFFGKFWRRGCFRATGLCELWKENNDICVSHTLKVWLTDEGTFF